MEIFHHLPGYKSAYNLVSLSACLGASLGPYDQGGIANLHKWESVSNCVHKLTNQRLYIQCYKSLEGHTCEDL